MKKLLRTILVTGGGIAALIGWQRWRTDQEHKELPAPGQLLDINGRKQHIRHLGNKNSDLLLLIDSGLGGYSAAWYKVLAQLPPDLQVVVIDRPGMGWSDPATTPRTSRHVDTVFAEFAGFTDSSKQIKTATQANPRPFKNLPLIALSSTPEITAKRIASIAPINQERFIDHWCDMQASLSQLSHQEELRLSKNSGHNIILEEPETVVQAMIDIVAQVQSA